MAEQGTRTDLQPYLTRELLHRPEKPLAGKAAFITGATRMNGIGFAIAERFALEGVSPIIIVGTPNSQDIAPFAVQRLQRYGVEAHALVGDVTDEASCVAMMQQANKLTSGNIDILVNNAGRTHNKSIVDTELEDWDAVVNTKLRGAFLLTREWFRARNKAGKRGGKVINIGSVTKQGNDGQVDYVAANAGLHGLTKTLAYNLGSRGVTANIIIPGFVEGTEITGDFDEQSKTSLKALQALAIGRLISPQDVAAAAAYLASSDADAVSGSAIVVDAQLGTNYTAPRRLRGAGWRIPPSFARGIVEDLTQDEVAAIKAMRENSGQVVEARTTHVSEVITPSQPERRRSEVLPYSERSVLVLGGTGANSIGRAAVDELHALGVRELYVGSTNKDNFDRLTGQYERAGRTAENVYPFIANVVDKDEVYRSARAIKEQGHGLTDVIFSHAGGMEGFIKPLIDTYLLPIRAITRGRSLYSLDEQQQDAVREIMIPMYEQIKVWREEAIPHGMAVNYQGTFDTLEVLRDVFPEGFNVIFINSTWGHLSGTPGVEIPLLYGPVDVSKAEVRDRLRRESESLYQQGIPAAELVASLVKGTRVGKMFQDYLLSISKPEQAQAIIKTAVTQADVFEGIRKIMESDPQSWPHHPLELFVTSENGKAVFSDRLEMSAMYSIPYDY